MKRGAKKCDLKRVCCTYININRLQLVINFELI